jgi:hypothetical protein
MSNRVKYMIVGAVLAIVVIGYVVNYVVAQ